MNPEASSHKEEYAKTVCYFLAEELRVQKINLSRAAEIAQKVVDNINLMDTEQDFLLLIKNLSGDFEELFQLEKRIQIGIRVSDRKLLEDKVREYVVNILPQDTNTALLILQEAVRDGVNKEELCKKFPQFAEFLEKDKI